MATTLSDFGRKSERFGEIGFYYAFTTRMYFGSHQVAPNDVLTWCREHATGYYRVSCYTHKSSKRSPSNPRKFAKKIVYVDRIYLSNKEDAMLIRLTFDVRETKVMRPKLERLKNVG